VKHAPALGILVIHFLIFAIVNQSLNPHPDMLDHWVWSRYLSFSYYEHPPMIAWLIRGITLIGGNTETALEVGSQLVTLSILALVYAGTFSLYGRKSALVTLLILCSMPYFTLGSIFLHITQPFLIFWIFALFLLIRFHQHPAKNWLLDWSCRRFWCTFQVHHAAFLRGAFSASFALPENPQGNFESMALCRRNGLTGNFYSGNYLEC